MNTTDLLMLLAIDAVVILALIAFVVYLHRRMREILTMVDRQHQTITDHRKRIEILIEANFARNNPNFKRTRIDGYEVVLGSIYSPQISAQEIKQEGPIAK